MRSFYQQHRAYIKLLAWLPLGMLAAYMGLIAFHLGYYALTIDARAYPNPTMVGGWHSLQAPCFVS